MNKLTAKLAANPKTAILADTVCWAIATALAGIFSPNAAKVIGCVGVAVVATEVLIHHNRQHQNG